MNLKESTEKTKALLDANLKKQDEIECAIKELIDRNFLGERYRALQKSLEDVKKEISMLIGVLKIQKNIEHKKRALEMLVPFNLLSFC